MDAASSSPADVLDGLLEPLQEPRAIGPSEGRWTTTDVTVLAQVDVQVAHRPRQADIVGRKWPPRRRHRPCPLSQAAVGKQDVLSHADVGRSDRTSNPVVGGIRAL